MGLAVVANEVEELAEQTAQATEDISQKIEAIRGETKGRWATSWESGADRCGSGPDDAEPAGHSRREAEERPGFRMPAKGRQLKQRAERGAPGGCCWWYLWTIGQFTLRLQ